VLGHESCTYHTHRAHQHGGPHDWESSAISVNDGAMDGFIASLPRTERWCVDRTAPECERFVGPDLQPDVMSWHDDREIPNYWTYADAFVLQDRMFAPADSWTLPAHLFLVSGWSAYCSDPSDPMSCVANKDLKPRAERWDYGEDPIYAWTDITWLLDRHDVSWAYYVAPGTCPFVRCRDIDGREGPAGLTPSPKNPLPGFTTLYETRQKGRIQTHEQFFQALRTDTLPSVTWVIPGNGLSDHPQSSRGIYKGQAYVTKLVNAVMRSEAWDSSAVFLTWDDWGGFYDHVPPTVVDEMGYGIRVPGLMMSPYAKQGYIDHQTLSFDAYLKLIEDRFLQGRRLDPDTLARPDARTVVRETLPVLGDLVNEFDFDQPPRPPLILDPTP
jgi:phospholipase C